MELVINGFFYIQRPTGVHRFARELMLELDKITLEREITIVVPEYARNIPNFKNIKIKKYGKTKGALWEQISFVRYLIKNNCESVNLCNTMPLLKPGIICIHDAAYKMHPEYFTTIHGKLSCIWHKIHYRLAAISKKPILTVSYFSKYQIIDAYKINPIRIKVIGNGWQHMKRIKLDESIIKNNNLIPGGYYFTLGNISKNKNTKWVYEIAKRYPEDTFVISGRKAEVSNEKYEDLKNIINLGYISDSQIKALYKNCKAFIFPSIHEGFGIPPMEALSQNAKIIVSNSTCLPEIYRDSAYYIDPYDTTVDLTSLLSHKISPSKNVLDRYSWKDSAKRLYEVICDYSNGRN